MLTFIFVSLGRRHLHHNVQMVIYIQSCMRRRLARKELKALKAEARSVSKFKEISYKLENKVVELTQTLQTRTAEKKDLQTKFLDLQQQLSSWMTKHEETDARGRHLQTELQSAQAEVAQREELLQAKRDVEQRLEDALVKITEKEDIIQKLTEDLNRQAQELSQRHRNAEMGQSRIDEDGSVVATLKNEVSNLREQLNRANALNALTRGGRAEPVSPTFVPALRSENGLPNGTTLAAPPGKRHQRRHSLAGGFGVDPESGGGRDVSDDAMVSVKRNQLRDPRAVSLAYNGQDNLSRFRTNGLTDIYDDPAEEKLKLLEDAKHLDEDILDGLIRGLKIPAPSSQNTLAAKEILFPANLISLTTNEMWKYGLIAESERFLANVMQAIQAHVMVR
jgi:myosin V